MSGWVKLRRDLAEEEIWTEEKPFTRGQALVDLLMRVTFRTHTSGGRRYRAGCVYTSTLALAERWGWSRYQVMRFLARMEKEKRLKVKANRQEGCEILVVGWNPAEEVRTGKPSVKPTQTDGDRTTRTTNRTYIPTVEPIKTEDSRTTKRPLQNTQVPVREEPERSITGGRLGVSPEGEPPRPVEEDPLDAMIAQWEASRCTN